LPSNFALGQERSWRPITTEALEAKISRRNRLMLIWLSVVVLIIVVTGAIYTVYLAKTTAPLPPLPAAPAKSTVLSKLSSTDMLDGNFVLDSALYRTNETPTQVLAFYKSLLQPHTNQIGNFSDPATSILPFNSPDALQHIPPAFHIQGAADADAAQYVYTEYNFDDHDMGIAVDTRFSKGPTLIYEEMLTQPSDSGF
jgi:hypothetical protein